MGRRDDDLDFALRRFKRVFAVAFLRTWVGKVFIKILNAINRFAKRIFKNT